MFPTNAGGSSRSLQWARLPAAGHWENRTSPARDRAATPWHKRLKPARFRRLASRLKPARDLGHHLATVRQKSVTSAIPVVTLGE